MTHAPLADRAAFAAYLAPLRKTEWVVYAKRPFGGPEAVLAYLSRYTHRVAISNSRLIAFDEHGVTFRWKDYRAEAANGTRLMTLATGEFIRRFLHPRAAQRLPPHPPLRPVRQRQACREHRARATAAQSTGFANKRPAMRSALRPINRSRIRARVAADA